MISGGYVLTYTNEFVDQLLTKERVCDIMLPHISKRNVVEETEGLLPRISALLEAMEGVDRRAEKDLVRIIFPEVGAYHRIG